MCRAQRSKQFWSRLEHQAMSAVSITCMKKKSENRNRSTRFSIYFRIASCIVRDFSNENAIQHTFAGMFALARLFFNHRNKYCVVVGWFYFHLNDDFEQAEKGREKYSFRVRTVQQQIGVFSFSIATNVIFITFIGSKSACFVYNKQSLYRVCSMIRWCGKSGFFLFFECNVNK